MSVRTKERLVIATIKPWNLVNALKFKKRYKEEYEVLILSDKEELNYDSICEFNPRYIFFPHWSWFIPCEIFKNYECVVFHMTDVPYGRGGSPLQNLIMRKIYDTKISAIKVVEKVDAGDIYMKEDFFIGSGSAKEIFQRASHMIFFKMIPHILENKMVPYPQKTGGVSFKRRRSEESDILCLKKPSLVDFYDFIRMLDADGYPRAFFRIDNLKIEFSSVNKKKNKLTGKFEVRYDNE